MKRQSKELPIVFLLVTLMMAFAFTYSAEASEYYGEPTPLLTEYEPFNETISGFLAPELDYQILVNTDHPFDFFGDYAINLENHLITVPDVYGEPTRVEQATYVAFTKLQAALAEQNIIIGLYSAYRTEADQQWVYDNYGDKDGWGNVNTVMSPGFSEHHTGLMINFLVWYQFPGDDNPLWATITAERQANYPDLGIIYDTLADYGFIERYPAGKEEITGIACEPYEIRFVGDTFTAHAIMDNGLCLEEYVDQLSEDGILSPDEYAGYVE